MKVNLNERIYLIAAIDSIVNGNVSNMIDLGKYQLEYLAAQEERISLMMDEGGIPSIQFMVKVRNKDTNKIEWAETYYKALKKYEYESIFELPLEEKKDFIFRSETLISRRKYSTSMYLIPSYFWRELETKIDQFDYPETVMPHNLSEEGKNEIINYANFLISEIEQRNKENMSL